MPLAEHSTFINLARSRLCVHITGQVKTCINSLDPEQLCWRPNDLSNSIGNLVLHCAGSTKFYIGHVIGNSDFVRDRDTEFNERRRMPHDELLAHLDAAISEANSVLSELSPNRLLEQTHRTRKPSTIMEVIELQLTHYALHTGQIAFATKILSAESINEIWRKTPTR